MCFFRFSYQISLRTPARKIDSFSLELILYPVPEKLIKWDKGEEGRGASRARLVAVLIAWLASP